MSEHCILISWYLWGAGFRTVTDTQIHSSKYLVSGGSVLAHHKHPEMDCRSPLDRNGMPHMVPAQHPIHEHSWKYPMHPKFKFCFWNFVKYFLSNIFTPCLIESSDEEIRWHRCTCISSNKQEGKPVPFHFSFLASLVEMPLTPEVAGL